MAFRNRQSGASATQRRTIAPPQAPPYEPPLNPLTPAAQNALRSLQRTHNLNNLQAQLKKANDLLSECAYDINDTLRDKDAYVRKKREGAEAQGTDFDASLEQDLQELRTKVTKMTERMEENVRKTIDGQQGVKDLEDALQFAQAGAQSATQRATQQQGQSFDPTLPGATEASTQAGPGPSEIFAQKVHIETDRYQTLSLYTRYAQHPDYIGFKSQVHEALYGDEVPVPPPSKWFREGRGSPAPGTAATGADGDSDDDIAIAREKISTKCPLTLKEFEDPVTSKKCPHSFERSAIMEMLHVRGRTVQCPVPGCTTMLTQSVLAPDPVLIRKIRRLQQARVAARDAEDSDMENDGAQGQNGNTSILLDASSVAGQNDDFEDMDDDDEDEPGRGTTRIAKTEPRGSRAPSAMPRSSRARAEVVDLGEEEEEEDEDDTEDEDEEMDDQV